MAIKHNVKNKKRKHMTSYYLRVYAISIVSSFVMFLVGSLFITPELPCANTRTCGDDLTVVKIDNTATGIFLGQKVTPPKIESTETSLPNAVLGANDVQGEKHIYVDLTKQMLFAFQGNTEVMQALVSTGKWGRTPTGNFAIWSKLRATRMAGGSGADYYNLPNVPYTMYFYRDYALHGAYWHNNFGHPMSHGCVNMRIVDAAELFAWADGPSTGRKGTAVSVCDTFEAPNTCVQNNPVL